jgi:hypothetical protein
MSVATVSASSSSKAVSKTIQTYLQKYIPQCDKQNHVILRFGQIVPSNYGSLCQLPIESEVLKSVQSVLQGSASKYKKTTISGYRVFHNGVYYEINRKAGTTTKIHRTDLFHGESGNILMNYIHIEEDSGIVPCIDEPDMEEEYEQTIYTSCDTGMNDVDWVVEYYPAVRFMSFYCIIRKPIQPAKLWKNIESLGLV